MNKSFPLIAAIFLVACLMSCQLPQQDARVVTIELVTASRTVGVDWTTLADTYIVTLTSEDGLQSFTASAPSAGILEFVGVPAGLWNVSATAIRSSQPVAGGFHQGLVVSSQGGATLSLTLTGDQQGTGGYSLSLHLPVVAGVTAVEGQLYDFSDNPVKSLLNPVLTTDGDVQVAKLEDSVIPGGVYRLAITVKRGTTVIGQFSEAVNIWTNVTSNQWLAPNGTMATARTLDLADLADGSTKLANLVLTSDYPLIPAFSSTISTYSISAPAGIAFLLTPTASQPGQSVELQVGNGNWTALPSGTTSAPLTTVNGTTVRLRVTAADRTTVSTYEITVSAADIYYRNTLADGGSPPAETASYNIGDWVVIKGNPGALTREGYQFAGWNTSADGLGTTLIEGVGYQLPAKGVTLYPIWIENKFSFTTSNTDAVRALELTGHTGPASSHLTVPNGVTSIGWYFVTDDESITQVTFPNTLISIQQNAFFHCTNLNTVDFPGSLTTLGNQAFWDCGFTTVSIPATITSLGSVPIHAKTLTAYTVDPANTNYASFGGLLYNKAGTELLAVPGATSGTFNVPPATTSIGWTVFASTSITTVNLPASLTSYHPFAFLYASDMTSITVDSGNAIYSSNSGLLLDKPGTTLLAVPYGFTGELTIPNGVTKVGDQAAASRQKITSIVFPASLTHILQNGLSNMNGLTTLTIPATVTTIESYALSGCYGLTSVTFEGSPALGTQVFNNSYELKTVILNASTPPPMAPYTFGSFFEGCHNDLVIKVPSGAVDAYKAAPGWSDYADRIVAAP